MTDLQRSTLSSVAGATLLIFLLVQLSGPFPSSAFALRPLNAGMEEHSPVNAELRKRLSPALNVAAGMEEVQKEFIKQVIAPISGAIPKNFDISMADDPAGFPVLSIRHRQNYKGQPIELSYRVEFRGVEIRAPEIASLSQTNLIQMPRLDIWTPEVISEAQKVWRRSTVADPVLNPRFVSEQIQLTPYQEESVPKTIESLDEKGHALVVMATATGKTVVAFQVVDQLIGRIKSKKEKPGAVIFVVNNRVILKEAEEKLHQVFGDKYRSSRVYEVEQDFSGDVIFATSSSLMSSNRLQELLKTRKVSVVIFDEVHHVPASQNRMIFRRVQEESGAKNWNTMFIGFTATETRPDRVSVIAFFGREIAYEYPVMQGWEDGFLTPMRYLSGDSDINPDNRGPILRGDPFYEHYLAQRYADRRFPHLFGLYQQHSERLLDKRTLILAPTIERANALTEYFRRQGVAAVTLTSEQRQDPIWFDHNYEAWKTGKWPEGSPYAGTPVPQVVTAVDIFREGIDAPAINLLILWADTDSTIRYMQSIGRGLRLFPYKTHLTVVDTVGLFRKVHLLRYLGGLFVERERGEGGVRVAGAGPAVGPETAQAMVGRGIEFGEDVTGVLKNYFGELAEHLEFRYGAYPLIPANEMPRLDRFLAKRAGFSSVDEFQDFLLDFSRRLVNGVSQQDSQAFRERCLPVFYHTTWSPELMRASLFNPNEIGVDAVAFLVFNRLNDLLTRLNPDITEQHLYKVFPEFTPDKEQIVKNRSENLKAIRLQVYGLTYEQMTKLLIKEVLPLLLSRKDKFNFDVTSELYHEQKEMDLGAKSEAMFLYAEGKKSKQDIKAEEEVVGESYKRTGAKFWQDIAVKAYLAHPTLAGKLTAEDFNRPAEDFLRYLTALGLTKGEKAARSFYSLIKKDTQAYVTAIAGGNQDFISEKGRVLNELINEPGNLAALEPQEMTKARMETLLRVSDQIDEGHRTLGDNLSAQDREIRKNFDRVLQVAGIHWEATLPELPGVTIMMKRTANLTDYAISVSSTNNQHRQAVSYPAFNIAVRTDHLQRPHAYLRNQEVNNLEALHAQLDEGGRRVLVDTAINAFGALRDAYGGELVLIVPQDRNGHGFFSELFQRILDTTSWDVLGQLKDVSADASVMDFSYDGTRGSRLSFLTPDTIRGLKGAYKLKDMSAKDKLAYIYISTYEYWHILWPQWQIVANKFKGYTPSDGTRPAFEYLKHQLESQIAKDVTGRARTAALQVVFNTLGVNHPEASLNDTQVRLASLELIVSFGLRVTTGYKSRGAIVGMLRDLRFLRQDLARQRREMPPTLAQEVQQFIDTALHSFLTTQDFPLEMEGQAKAFEEKFKGARDNAPRAENVGAVQLPEQKVEALREGKTTAIATKPPFYNEDGELLFFVSGKKKKTLHIDHYCPLNDVNTEQVYTRDQVRAGLRGFTICKACKTPPIVYWEDTERDFYTKYGGKGGKHVWKPKSGESDAGLEEVGGMAIDGLLIPLAGTSLNWYSTLGTASDLVPTRLLDILDPERDRVAMPLANISSKTTVFVEEKEGKPIISGRVVDALEAAGVKVERFTLENVPQGYSDRENVYLVDVPVGSEREWVLDPSAIVINFRSDNPSNRPNSPEELGALINVAREADRRVLWVGAIYRSDLQNAIIAIDTQL